MVALWPVGMQVMLETWFRIPRGVPTLKSLRQQCQPPSVIPYFLWSVSWKNVLDDSVRVTKKKHSDSCRPAWREMDRRFVLQLLLLKQKEVELLYYYYYYYYSLSNKFGKEQEIKSARTYKSYDD